MVYVVCAFNAHKNHIHFFLNCSKVPYPSGVCSEKQLAYSHWLGDVTLRLGRFKFKACSEQVLCKHLVGSKDVLIWSHNIVVIDYHCDLALIIRQCRAKILKGTVDSDEKKHPLSIAPWCTPSIHQKGDVTSCAPLPMPA